MNFKNPIITQTGIDMSTAAFFGSATINIDSIKIGSGIKSNPDTATGLQNYELDAEIISFERKGRNIELVFTFDNSSIEEGFSWKEYGVFATLTNGELTSQGLYAYGYDDSENPQAIPKFTGSNSYVKNKYKVVLAARNADNVTVTVSTEADYALEEDLEAHVEDYNNPHAVTKEQVGLSNVDNVSTNDATPTFTEAEALSNINSGERATIIFGKIKKAISALISHISAGNPHNISISKIGAAAANHNHSATEITSGILPVSRGGTGYDSYAKFSAAFIPSLFGRGFSYAQLTGADYNNITDGGIYFCSWDNNNPQTNAPSIGTLSGSLFLVVFNNGNNAVLQFAMAFSTVGAVHRLYVRQRRSGGIWGSWSSFKTE